MLGFPESEIKILNRRLRLAHSIGSLHTTSQRHVTHRRRGKMIDVSEGL
jgi:hypothetical protein